MPDLEGNLVIVCELIKKCGLSVLSHGGFLLAVPFMPDPL
jgi:hypothetical protein